MIASFESVADNFAKNIRFKKTYEYDTFKDKKKVDEIKKEFKEYLPEDMM